jgi:hypothetical protein
MSLKSQNYSQTTPYNSFLGHYNLNTLYKIKTVASYLPNIYASFLGNFSTFISRILYNRLEDMSPPLISIISELEYISHKISYKLEHVFVEDSNHTTKGII